MKELEENNKKYKEELTKRLETWSDNVRATVKMIIEEEVRPIIKEIIKEEAGPIIKELFTKKD